MPRILFAALICLVAMVFLAGAAAIVLQQRTPFSTNRIGGPFDMVDVNGARVTQDDLLGKPTVLYFGYTSCPDVCPTTLALLTSAMRKMGGNADRLNVVFVTVDPERDTREEMKAYLSSFDPRIRGLTGTEAQVAAMADTFHVYRKRTASNNGSYDVAHSANAFLLDGDERMVGEIYYGEDEPSVFAKLTTLAPEPVCRPGAPGPADLWAQSATFGPGRLCGST